MGSNKFLIIALAIVSALALSLVGVSAAETIEADTLEDVTPSEEIPFEREEEVRVAEETLESVLRETYGSPGETYPALPLLEKSYYSYDVTFLSVPRVDAVNVVSIAVYDADGNYVSGASNGDGALLFRSGPGSANWGYSFGGESYVVGLSPATSTVYSSYRCVLISTESSLALTEGIVNGSLVESSPVDDIASSVWSVGDALITFVLSSWVVLLPLSCWLVVLCIGAIRKLVKGV